MNSSRRNRTTREPSRHWPLRIILGLIGSCAIILVGLILWTQSFLHSAAFRALINAKAGELLRAETSLTPLSWEGSALYTERLDATGTTDSLFSSLTVQSIRADLDLYAAFSGAWRVTDARARSLDLTLSTPGTPSSAPSSSITPKKTTTWPFLPTRFELRQLDIASTTARWPLGGDQQGRIENSHLTLRPTHQGIEIQANGGTLIHPGAPHFTLDTLLARYSRQRLYITENRLRLPEGGQLNLTGEADLHSPPTLTLRGELDRLSITPFLPDDWRARLRGAVNGDLQIDGDPSQPHTLDIQGKLTLLDGRLEALPFLDQLALFLKTEEFRSMPLQRGTAEFRRRNGTLTVPRFDLTSEGLFKAYGSFTVDPAGTLLGTCQLGVSSRTLQWLPGAANTIFLEPKDGYLWTTVTLGGTSARPQENLSSRLIQSAAGVAIDQAHKALQSTEGATKAATELLEKTTSTALDLLLPLAP